MDLFIEDLSETWTLSQPHFAVENIIGQTKIPVFSFCREMDGITFFKILFFMRAQFIYGCGLLCLPDILPRS